MASNPEARAALDSAWAEWLKDRGPTGKLSQGAAWRRDNPGEWSQLQSYRAGGARPDLVSNTGRQMVFETDAWNKVAAAPNTGPEVTLVEPVAGATLTAAATAFYALATDPDGVSKVDLYVNGALVGSETSSPYGWGGPDGGAPFDLSGYANGPLTFEAVAFDTAQNSTRVSHGVTLNVVGLPPTGDWATPTPRSRRVVGQHQPAFQEDTLYENCTGMGAVLPRAAKHFTIVGGDWPGYAYGYQDFWIGGRPGALMNRGPLTTGGDLLQVKRHPVPDGVLCEDGVWAFIDFHDVSRPDGSTAHPDCVQVMSGRRLTFGGCLFRNTGNAVQPWFVRDAGASAGGGPCEDITITDCKFSNVTHFYSIRVAGNDEVGDTGRFVPTRVTIRNCDLGGKNAACDRAAVDRGLVFEGNTNGTLVVP